MQRCRAVGLALLRHSPVVMVLDADGEGWRSRLEAEGFRVALEGTDLAGPWQGSVFDGYRFSRTTIQWLLTKAAPLVAIDDFLAPPLGAALVINPAPGLEGNVVKGIPALLGPRYALLDERFSAPPRGALPSVVEHVVVTFGVRDAANATGLALKALRLLEGRGFHFRVTVVLGSNAPFRSAVQEEVRELRETTLMVDVHNMPALLRSADLVIGAGGVSLLERMACAVPSITLCLAENQKLSIGGAVQAGATGTVEWQDRGDPAQLARAIAALAQDHARRQAMAETGRRLVDGRGASRVAVTLLNLGPQDPGSVLPLTCGEANAHD